MSLKIGIKLGKPLPERQKAHFSGSYYRQSGIGKQLLKNSPIYEPKSLELQDPILIPKKLAKIPEVENLPPRGKSRKSGGYPGCQK